DSAYPSPNPLRWRGQGQRGSSIVTTVSEILLAQKLDEREVVVRSLGEKWARPANRAFGEWAHGGQVAPAGDDWRAWWLVAGRGFGKTRAGAEWVLGLVRAGKAHPRPLPQAGGEGRSPSRWREGLGVGRCAASGQAHPRPLPQAGGEDRLSP